MNATGSPRLSTDNCELTLSSLPKVSRSPTQQEDFDESLNASEKSSLVKLIKSASASPNSRSGCTIDEEALPKRGENGINGSSERTNGGGSSEEQIDEFIEENGSTPKQGRFNLRKRSNVFGSYEGYNDSDMSGQLNGKSSESPDPSHFLEQGYIVKRKPEVYNYDTNTLIAAAKKMKTFNGSSIKSVSEEFGVPQSTMKRFYMKYQQGIILQVVDMHPRGTTGSNGTKTPTDGPFLSEDKLPSPEDSENDDDSFVGVTGSNGTKKQKGYSCALSAEEETRLVDYVLCLSRCGKSLNMTDIRNIAASILASSDKVAFKNSNLPSSGWLRRFKIRHPELEYKSHDYALNKTHQPLTRPELKAWEFDLRNFLLSDWKVEIDTFFSQENGSRIYTCDEIVIAFNKLDGKSEKISKPAEEKELVSVIASASAQGQYLKPFLVLPGDNSKATKSFPTLDPNSYVFQSSQSGLLNADIFNTWVTYFDSYLTQNDIRRPVVLLLDDHQAHFEIKNFLFCLDKQIVPVCLPGKLNKILQPLLANFFPKLMVAYQACCKRYTQKTGRGITYESFPYVMMKAWTLVSKSKFITDGFTHCKWIPMNICSHECVAEVPLENGAAKVASKEEVSDLDSSSLATSLPIKRELSEDPTIDVPKASPAPKKMVKKRKLSHGLSSTSSDRSVILGDKSVPDERKLGRQEGIDMCLSVLESFVPTDILPVWKARTSTHNGTCEVEYCMWQAVKMLANGGLEVVSQMQKQQLQLSTPK